MSLGLGPLSPRWPHLQMTNQLRLLLKSRASWRLVDLACDGATSLSKSLRRRLSGAHLCPESAEEDGHLPPRDQLTPSPCARARRSCPRPGPRGGWCPRLVTQRTPDRVPGLADTCCLRAGGHGSRSGAGRGRAPSRGSRGSASLFSSRFRRPYEVLTSVIMRPPRMPRECPVPLSLKDTCHWVWVWGPT